MIRPQTFMFLASAVVSSMAAPHLGPRDDAPITDIQILQFAITLEQLENAFYHEGLTKLDEKAFEDAGYPPWVRARFLQIKEHEQTHVDFLSAALGDQTPQPCIYSFPYDDPKSFAALSMALETVGESAYVGAAHLIQDKETLTEAASILAVEAEQAAWVSSAVLKGSAWSGAFATPLTFDGVYSLASQFIVSCPESNPKLPVRTLPRLTIQPASPHPNDVVQFTFDRSVVQIDGVQLYAAWFDGISVQYSTLDGENKAVIPAGLQGTVFAAVVKTKDQKPAEQEILTGLVMFEIDFPSYVGNP